MRQANAQTVLGDFNDAKFTHAGVTSRFFQRDGKFIVNTDGPDGRSGDFEIQYTFGVAPLQQYLVEFPGGRLQALGIAWDARPKADGGQRWFHLYSDRELKAGNPLHWTGIDQNWNFQCADCHSTDLRKNFDAISTTFKTMWSEVNVGCEACHGPASRHVAWAKKEGDWQKEIAGKGLVAALDERRGVTWTMDAAKGDAARSKPRQSQREIEVCARCHARRAQFSDEHHAGQRFHDAFRPALLEPRLYYADGQQQDEVYKYGSFLQSRMHAQGVTCSDCHEPHTQKLRAAGNAVCAQCHVPAKYDAASHHHHASDSKGTACAACHMPTTTFMVVDPRHDHSMRIPRPDRTAALGTPNACNGCHADKSAQWAADQVKKWYPEGKSGLQTFAEAFHAAERGAPGARSALLRIVEDRTQPAFVRASAIARLGRYLGPVTLGFVVDALNDADANVRMAAVNVLAAADVETRLRYLPRMLDDSVRIVRMDAARALAGEPERRLPAEAAARFAAALELFIAAQRFNADRPESYANLGGLHLARGEYDPARAAFRQALAIDPTFVQAAVNLADSYRAQERDAEAEATLRKALETNPDSAVLHHTLGLALVRQKRVPEAIAELGAAVKLAPEDPRLGYVYAIALHDTGQRDAARKALEANVARHPYNRESLAALALYEREAGELERARQRVRLLRELEPEDRGIAKFEAELERAGPQSRQ
jgi:tetratricopeptide (TPR) repeat protein